MEQSLFEAKFSSISKKLSDAQGNYDFKTAEETWDNIGTNPLDVALTELSELYWEADSTQRRYIFEQAGLAKLPDDLWYFIRRVAKQIQSQGDSKWLEIGLIASLIDGARADFRDLISSLVLLRFTAEIHNIDAKLFFDNIMPTGDEEMESILLNARNHSESDVHFIVQAFGWPELINESKRRFGEHPSAVKLRNAGPPREINCSTILIVLLIVLGVAIYLFVIR